MQSPYLEAGRIVAPHGVRGEVKIEPWTDTPDFLRSFDTLYIDGAAVGVLKARVHKNAVVAQLEGIERLEDAEALRQHAAQPVRQAVRLAVAAELKVQQLTDALRPHRERQRERHYRVRIEALRVAQQDIRAQKGALERAHEIEVRQELRPSRLREQKPPLKHRTRLLPGARTRRSRHTAAGSPA